MKEECKGGACGETFQEGDENNYFWTVLKIFQKNLRKFWEEDIVIALALILTNWITTVFINQIGGLCSHIKFSYF